MNKLRTINLMGEITEKSVADTIDAIREYTDVDTYNLNVLNQLVTLPPETVATLSNLNDGVMNFDNLNKLMSFAPEPIFLTVSSMGGLVYPALALHDEIKNSNTPIITIASGYCMSAGLFIFLAGHQRYATESTSFLYHEMTSGAYGTTTRIKDDVADLDRLSKLLTNIVLANTKISPKKIKKINRHQKDWYFGVDEAIKLGVIEDIW